jgi:glutaconate CoA-transferase subunit A
MGSKLSTAEEAIDGIRSGATVAMGGTGLLSRPMRLCAMLAGRGQVRDLTLVDLFGGLNVDWLVGAGAVGIVRSSFVSLEVFGLAPCFRRAVEAQTVRFIEESELSVVQALRARALEIPFLPVPDFRGTAAGDAHPHVRTVRCPFSGEEIACVPPLAVDVALVHALEADPEGNAVLPAGQGCDLEICAIADLVVVSAERIVPTAGLSRPANLPGALVSAVVPAPLGGWPGASPPLYGPDVRYLADYALEPHPVPTALKGRAPWQDI